MMRTIAFLALLAGVSALSRPNTDLMRMTLKSRGMSDVSLEMEADERARNLAMQEPDQSQSDDKSQESDEPTPTEMVEEARWAFGGLGIAVVSMGAAIAVYTKGPGAVEVPNDDGSQQRGWHCYNIVVPTAMTFMSAFMFLSVVGAIMKQNETVYDAGPKTNVPGYEGQSVVREKMLNPGERAFFASFALLAQIFIGFMSCLWLRKQQEVKLATSIIMKMGFRGAVAGVLCTFFVEFVRLPFHDYMAEEDLVVGRIFVVLLWVAVVAIMEEALKLALAFAGLKRSENDTEPSVPGSPITQFIVEGPYALAICGLAAGVGFAFIENIPRMYALALEKPLATVSQSQFGGDQQETFLIEESTLRAGRVWTFVFWGLLNIHPWLTALAALQLSKMTAKGPLSPTDWFNALKFVVMLHFFFDLLDRSAHPFVELMGCCAIPYAMYTFKKQWSSLATTDGELLEDHE